MRLAPLPWHHPAVLLGTWGGSGFLRPAPGTWGTLAALPFGLALLAAGGPAALAAGVIAVYIAGFFAAQKIEDATGRHDLSEIVVDEVAGMWIALIPAALAPLPVLSAFLFFRLFDVTKLGPIGWCDKRLPGAHGVMLDDILAGIAAALCLMGLDYAGLL